MKLLEDIPSAETHRRPHMWLTLTMTVVLLVTATTVGTYLVAQSSDGRQQSLTDGAATGEPAVSLTEWAQTATTTCRAVASAHPILTEGADARITAANLVAVNAGIQALADGIRGLPPLTAESENAEVSQVIAAADSISQAFQALAAADHVTDAQLSQAVGLADALITRLIELGADCSAMS